MGVDAPGGFHQAGVILAELVRRGADIFDDPQLPADALDLVAEVGGLVLAGGQALVADAGVEPGDGRLY
jgi:hypothetical protein